MVSLSAAWASEAHSRKARTAHFFMMRHRSAGAAGSAVLRVLDSCFVVRSPLVDEATRLTLSPRERVGHGARNLAQRESAPEPSARSGRGVGIPLGVARP